MLVRNFSQTKIIVNFILTAECIGCRRLRLLLHRPIVVTVVVAEIVIVTDVITVIDVLDTRITTIIMITIILTCYLIIFSVETEGTTIGRPTTL
jgi:hypothetical protein